MAFSRLHGYLIIAQLSFAGFEVLSRIALTKGINALAFTFYRNCCASLLLGAIAFFTERRHKTPSVGTLVYFFGLGFLGVTVNQVCYLRGLKYTSAIFASAMRNSTPVFTFVIAAIWRIEKVHLRRRDGQFKVFGSLLGLCGSLILSIYRGPAIIENVNISIANHSGTTIHHVDKDAIKTLRLFGFIRLSLASWQIGAIFLSISCAAFGVFLILQAPVLKNFPAPISFAAFACFSSVVQLPLLGAAYEHEWNAWKLMSTSEAVAVVYAGLIGSGLVSSIQSWGVLTQGPVIVAAYQPLETIFTAIFSMIFLKEALHLGSVIGGAIVIVGLYILIWGQKVERFLDEAAVSQLPPDISVLELRPDLSLRLPLRRHSCDLETRRNENERSSSSIQPRRHSLTFGTDLQVQTLPQVQTQKQGPLRRMSSTFLNIFGDLENGDGQAIRKKKLLPENTSKVDIVVQ